MCMVSMVMNGWQEQHKWEQPHLTFTLPVGREEFEALKREVESLKKVLKAARLYDSETGQPDCEMEDKKRLLMEIAEKLGIDMSEVFSG